jgi:protein phosphatase
MTNDQIEITAKLDTADLAKAWADKQDRKPKLMLDLAVAARTDMGRVRENNEDKFDFFQPDELPVLAVKGSFFAVADGMGGHESGQVASELGLKTVLSQYYADPDEDVEKSLAAALVAANSYVYETAQVIPGRNGMGTTCTTAVFREDELFVGHVGDSRAYLIRNGNMEQVTEDHSWVAEQVKRGAFTEQEAASSPFRNVITRSLGAAPEVEPDVYRREVGDVLLLCSDGLTGYVDDPTILEIANSFGPSLAALKLVQKANENGGGDNVTVVIVAVRDIVRLGRRSRLGKLLGRE